MFAIDLMHTHIKTEIMFVYVHVYNEEGIISSPFLKIQACGTTQLLYRGTGIAKKKAGGI